jgi:hypothetical protein
LHSTKWSNGDKKRGRTLHSSKNKKQKTKTKQQQKQDSSMEDLVGNKENGHLFPDSNKTMINIFNESRDTQKKKIPQTGNHGSGQ